MNASRRNFLKKTSVITGGALLGGKFHVHAGSGSISNLIKIDQPFHGAVLNFNHGTIIGDGLKIYVKGQAPLGSSVTVNGTDVSMEGTRFSAEIILSDTETDINATAKGWFGENSHNIRVVWAKNVFKKYGFEIDDNIFCLRDIARAGYDSIFDCFYLKGLRDLHRKYGTKFVLNIYYTDGLEYTDREEFTIDHFPDRYKGEWQDNSDWLKLTFHAYSNLPDRPYQHAAISKFISDMDKVTAQIHRFAGKDSYITPSVIHWNFVPAGSYKKLSEHGFRIIRGRPIPLAGGTWDLNLNLDAVRSEYLTRHEAFKDFESGIVFAVGDLCCNRMPLDDIVPFLEMRSKDPEHGINMDLETHEQYFWPFYKSYIPDHFDRLDTAIRWVTDHGYKPVFWHEDILGIR